MQCGKYTIVKELARGGMGVVYEATTPEGEQRAIKMLKPQARLEGDIAERFQREIQVLSYLDSQHVVRFYEAGVAKSGELWVALELLSGMTLRQIIKMTNGRLAHERVIRWGRHIAQGVHEAHKLGVIHRDLKPANIAVVDDIAKVFDFGIAKYRNWGVPPTMLGVSMGTISYMAPEQFNGESSDELGPACDVYALGVILYELFSGKHPLREPGEKLDMHAAVFRILALDPEKLSDVIPGFPPALSDIINKALAKRPGDRFQSMMELNDELATVQRAMADQIRHSLIPDEETDEYETAQVNILSQNLHSDSIETPNLLLRAYEANATAPIPVPKKERTRLIQVVGPEPGIEYFVVDDIISVGRDESNDIDLNHTSVSRFHAKLRPLGDHTWEVADCGSTNGVHINGETKKKGVFGPGDAIEFGDVRLRMIPPGKQLVQTRRLKVN